MENLSEIYTFFFKKMHLKTSYAKWRPFCLGLSVLMRETVLCHYVIIRLRRKIVHTCMYQCIID